MKKHDNEGLDDSSGGPLYNCSRCRREGAFYKELRHCVSCTSSSTRKIDRRGHCATSRRARTGNTTASPGGSLRMLIICSSAIYVVRLNSRIPSRGVVAHVFGGSRETAQQVGQSIWFWPL